MLVLRNTLRIISLREINCTTFVFATPQASRATQQNICLKAQQMTSGGCLEKSRRAAVGIPSNFLAKKADQLAIMGHLRNW